MAIVGFNSAPTGNISALANSIWVTRIQMPENGNLDTISAYVNIHDASWAQYRLVVYSDNAGAPDALLATSAALWDVPAAGMQVVTAPPIAPLSLTSGTYYWIGAQLMHDSTTWGIIGTAADGIIRSHRDTSIATWGSAPPSTFTTEVSTDLYNLAAWIDYTAEGGGTPDPNPGLRIDVNDVNGNPIIDYIEVGVVVYDVFGGTELFQTSLATVVDGVITIDDDAVGNIGDVVYVTIRILGNTIAEDINGSGRQTVVDLETGDIS